MDTLKTLLAIFDVCEDIKIDESKVNMAPKSKIKWLVMFFSFSTTYLELGNNQVGSSKGKEISRETHYHSVGSEDSVDQKEKPASPVTSSSFEHPNVESSYGNDRKDLPCDPQVSSNSSSRDSSTGGDTENSDSTKPAEESVDKS